MPTEVRKPRAVASHGVSAPLWHVAGSREKPIYPQLSQGFPNPSTLSLFLSVICDLLMKHSGSAILDLFTSSAEVAKNGVNLAKDVALDATVA